MTKDHTETLDDPKRLIEQAFEMGAEFPGPAEDLLLSWMLSLPMGVDAPKAARRLEAKYRPAGEALASATPVARLLLLLRQTADAGDAQAFGRRGGRRRRQ